MGDPPAFWDGVDENPQFVEWMMGFPQDWTKGVPVEQGLKMLGNSVQVQMAEYAGCLVARSFMQQEAEGALVGE